MADIRRENDDPTCLGPQDSHSVAIRAIDAHRHGATPPSIRDHEKE
jgi:hypothetical protein